MAEAQKTGAVTLNYGLFLNAISKFLIVAFVLFLLINQINRLVGTKPAKDARRRSRPKTSSASRNPRPPEEEIAGQAESVRFIFRCGMPTDSNGSPSAE